MDSALSSPEQTRTADMMVNSHPHSRIIDDQDLSCIYTITNYGIMQDHVCAYSSNN
jgi:hypothetical protein